MFFFSEFGWKRCLFRTISVCVLLFVAESIPSFGALLDVVGASTVTMLTFVCPPFFYMKLCDQSLDNNRPKDWPLEWKRYVYIQCIFSPFFKKMLDCRIVKSQILNLKLNLKCNKAFWFLIFWDLKIQIWDSKKFLRLTLVSNLTIAS